MWRDRRWRFLLNLIDHLPSHSFFVEAQLNDEELAEASMKDGASSEPRRPRVSQWDPVLAELTSMSDRIGELISLTARVNGGKGHVQPRPRPVTAFDKARDRAARADHLELVARLIKP